MLSKSSAKVFFIGGTALCSIAFLLLTADTLAQFPERSHEDRLTAEVERGWRIWERNNCMGCHTLMGEGAYYAPELTRVVERRGEGWIRAFLADPETFFPGRRKMIKYDFFDPALDPEAGQNVSDVLAFFHWVQEIDTSGFPPKPDIVTDQTRSQGAKGSAAIPARLEGAPEYFRSVCIGCHAVGGMGGNVGPALDGVADRYDEEYLRNWIRSPQDVKPGTVMPNLGLDETTLDKIVQYLLTLREATS